VTVAKGICPVLALLAVTVPGVFGAACSETSRTFTPSSGRGGSVSNGGKADSGGDGGQQAPAGGAAGNDGDGGSAGSEPDPIPDTTRPTVTSISPEDGATGVTSDTAIVVTFSEPVNQEAAEAAFTTDFGDVTFTWNDAGTELTATPDAPLAYATSDNPDVAANSFRYWISTGVEDLAGNHLQQGSSAEFTTLRQIAITFSVATGDIKIISDYDGGAITDGSSDGGAWVGDDGGNTYSRPIMDFDIGSLPDGAIGIATATLTVEIVPYNPTGGVSWGTPFADLGTLNVDHVHDDPIDISSLDAGTLSSLGVLMASTDGSIEFRTLDVTEPLADDVAERVARGDRSQYRLQFSTKTNGDAGSDMVAVRPFRTHTIEAEYLIP
jgi:hypothetical protein